MLNKHDLVMTGDPVTCLRPDGASPILLMCDHASRALPEEYGDLGLPKEVFDQHVAYDIGARDMTIAMSEALNATAFLANWSRLLIDPNRSPDEPGYVPTQSDGIEIPGNQNLTMAEIGERQRALHEPFHDAIASHIQSIRRRNIVPLIVGVHSFTPIMQGAGRPWQVGILWNRDPRLAEHLLTWLRQDPALTVGDNEPYSGKVLGHSMNEHGGANGFANVVIEVRQDLIDTPETAARWGRLMADALVEISADAELFEIRHY